MIDPLYAASGLGVGVLVGLSGVGGGSLMTPLLILMFGVHPATAVGTDLLFAACTKTVGVVIHAKRRTIDWTVTGRLAAGSIPATILTLLVLGRMELGAGAAARVITPVLAVVLVMTAVMLLFQRRLLALFAGRVAAVGPRTLVALNVGAGALLGVLVSLSSVGAGALGVTLLMLLYPALPPARIVGSDIAHAIPLTLIAGSGYWMMGSVDWALLGSLLSGSIPGIVVGTMLATTAPAAVLRVVLAAVLVAVGATLLA